ncbi:glycosyltransferase family 4 protein [Kordiimonas sp.]|uniref:glycosyltransferase family 4 protein n=1 Tax=Kordiimonas sp. TaxID=1970157 RepID=UPI003A953809
MKILFITDNFPPEVNAPASRTYEHCREWVRQGAEVTVITCAPNFPQGKVYPGYKNRLYSQEIMDGIKVIRVWSYITANAGFMRRVLDYMSFAMSAFIVGLSQETHIIVATSPQFFTTFTGYSLSFAKRRPWVFELRDLWPESIITVGAMKKGAAIRMLEKAEQFMYRQADMIVPVTDAFRDRLIDYGVAPEKITVVTNGVDKSVFPVRAPDEDLLDSLGLKGKFILGYVGTHGMAHGLDFVVQTLSEIDDSDVHLLCVGDGAAKADVVARAHALGLKNVTFLDPVEKSRVGDYLSILDAVLVPLRKSDTFKTVIPSKIFEAAAMEKPILLGVDGQARKIIEEYDAGLYFEPENGEALRAAIVALKEDKSRYSACQAGCRQLATAYDRKTLAQKMLAAITAFVRGTE